jgi:hypothetical protein
VAILKDLRFNAKDIVDNIRRFRQWRNHLPILPIYSHKVKISTKKTPSTSTVFKQAYYFSIKDIISQVLNNPKLLSQMYFGEGKIVENKSEYWHGEVWAESPLFGQKSLQIQRGALKSGRLFDIIIMILTVLI